MMRRGSTYPGNGPLDSDAFGERATLTHVTVPFGLEELWFLQSLVRQHDKLGQVWDRSDMRQIHRGILALSALSPERQGNTTYEIECDEGLLWLMEQQVPMTLAVTPDTARARSATCW